MKLGLERSQVSLTGAVWPINTAPPAVGESGAAVLSAANAAFEHDVLWRHVRLHQAACTGVDQRPRGLADGIGRRERTAGATLRGGARLAQEPLAQLRIGAHLARQDLHRYGAIEAHFTCEVDDPHATPPDLPLEHVRACQQLLQGCKRLSGQIRRPSLRLRVST